MRKSKLFLVISSLLLVITVGAQVQVELKLGLDNSSAIIDGVSDNIVPTINNVVSPSAGITASYRLDKYFSVGTGVSYQKKGFNIKEGTSFNLAGIDIPVGVELRYRETSMRIPLYLQYTYPINKLDVYIKTGASANLGLGGNYKTIANSIINITLSDTPIDYDQRIQKTVYNGEIAAGIAYEYNGGKILGEIRYTRAFTNKIEDTTFDLNLKEKTVSARIGYAMVF